MNGLALQKNDSLAAVELMQEISARGPSKDPTQAGLDEDIPFEPGRTVEVTKKEWRSLTSRPTPKPRRCHPGRATRSDRSIFGLPVLRPGAALVNAWATVITLVDLTYTAFLVPISIAFDELLLGTSFTWLTYMDCCGTAFYIVDMFLELHTGYIIKYDIHRALVMQGTLVAERYVRHGGFVIDLLATLAIVPELVVSAVPGLYGSGFKALYALRLLRLLRVIRLLRVAWDLPLPSSPLSRVISKRLNTATFFLLTIIFLMAVSVNLLGCMWWFLAEMEGLESSWVAHANLGPTLLTASGPARYVASVYFAMTILTTVGFGDIVPWTVAEMVVAVLYMLLSALYFGYVVNVVGQLLAMVSVKSRAAAAVREKLEDTEHWMMRRHIPREMQARIRRYYYEVWAPHTASLDDTQSFSELPMDLRGEIVDRLAGDAMRESRMLRLLSPQVREHLASCALPLRLVAGHDLYREGEPADRFWVLQEGEAAVIRGLRKAGGVRAPAILGQAAVFAEWVEECRERLHTVRAVTNCTLWEFDGRTLYRVAKHHPDVLLALCTSYLRYIDELEAEALGSGAQVPKRVPRIRAQVEQLLAEAEVKLALQREQQRQGTAGQARAAGEEAEDEQAVAAEEQQVVGGSSDNESVGAGADAGAAARPGNLGAVRIRAGDRAPEPSSGVSRPPGAAAAPDVQPSVKRSASSQPGTPRPMPILERMSASWRGPSRWRTPLHTFSTSSAAVPEEEQFREYEDLEYGTAVPAP